MRGSTCFLQAPANSSARFVRLPAVLYLQEPFRWLYEALPQLPWLARPGPSQSTPLSVYRLLKDLVRVQGLRIQAREEVESAKAYVQILVNSFFSRESVLQNLRVRQAPTRALRREPRVDDSREKCPVRHRGGLQTQRASPAAGLGCQRCQHIISKGDGAACRIVEGTVRDPATG